MQGEGPAHDLTNAALKRLHQRVQRAAQEFDLFLEDPDPSLRYFIGLNEGDY